MLFLRIKYIILNIDFRSKARKQNVKGVESKRTGGKRV